MLHSKEILKFRNSIILKFPANVYFVLDSKEKSENMYIIDKARDLKVLIPSYEPWKILQEVDGKKTLDAIINKLFNDLTNEYILKITSFVSWLNKTYLLDCSLKENQPFISKLKFSFQVVRRKDPPPTINNTRLNTLILLAKEVFLLYKYFFLIYYTIIIIMFPLFIITLGFIYNPGNISIIILFLLKYNIYEIIILVPVLTYLSVFLHETGHLLIIWSTKIIEFSFFASFGLTMEIISYKKNQKGLNSKKTAFTELAISVGGSILPLTGVIILLYINRWLNIAYSLLVTISIFMLLNLHVFLPISHDGKVSYNKILFLLKN